MGKTSGKGCLTAARPWTSAMLGLQCSSAGPCTPGNLCISLGWDRRWKFLSALQQLLTVASYSSLKKSSASVLNHSGKNSEILAQQFQWQAVVGFHVTCILKDTNNSKYVSGKTETMFYLHLTSSVQWALAHLFESLLHSNNLGVRLVFPVFRVYLLWFCINKCISLQGVEMLTKTWTFKRM